MTLRLPALMGSRHLCWMTSRRAASLASRAASTSRAAATQGGQAVAVLQEVLLPADEVDVLEQHLDLAPDQEALEGGVVEVDVVDVDLLDVAGLGLDAGEGGLDVAELALDGEGEGGDRALHALEDVDAEQVDEALLAVHLAEEARCRP